MADLVRGGDDSGGVFVDVADACDGRYRNNVAGGVEDWGSYGVDSFDDFFVRDKVPLFLDVPEVVSVDRIPGPVQVAPPGFGRQVGKDEASNSVGKRDSFGRWKVYESLSWGVQTTAATSASDWRRCRSAVACVSAISLG